MFRLGTPVLISEDGWVVPAGPEDKVWGIVCGEIDPISHKVPISKISSPDVVVSLYYDVSVLQDVDALEKACARQAKPKKRPRKEKK